MKLNSANNRFNSATDPAEMRDRVAAGMRTLCPRPPEITEVAIPRVFPRSDGGFTIQYRVGIKGQSNLWPHSLTLCGHLLGDNESRPAWVDRYTDKSLAMDDIRLYLPLFPFDPQLDLLDQVHAAADAIPWLAPCLEAMDRGGEVTGISSELLAYRLQRRCVIRYTVTSRTASGTSETTQIIAKYMKSTRAAMVANVAKALSKDGFDGGPSGRFTIPRIHHVTNDGIILMESAPGSSLHDLTSESGFVAGCTAAGELLKKLHTHVAPPSSKHSFESDLAQLSTRIETSTRLFPQWSGLWRQAYETCLAGLNDLEQGYQATCIHGDFYDKQIMYSPERTTLLDYDNVAAGDAAQDVGNFVAHMSLRALQGTTDKENIEHGMDAFVRAYDIPNDGFQKRMRWWRTTTTLRLATLYCLRPKWRHLTQVLLQEMVKAGHHPTQYVGNR